MKRRLLGALALAALLVGAGLLVQRMWLGGDDAAAVAPSADRAPPPAATPDAATTAAKQPTLRVTAIDGTVEVSRDGGPWQPVEAGIELSAADSIRTGPDGVATIAVGDTATVQLAESSQFGAADISRTISSVRLEGGRMTAQVHGQDGSTLRVEVRGSDAVAEADQGDELAVLSDDNGRVAVAATRGDVSMTAGGKRVEIGEGQVSRVTPGTAPSAPTEIPPELYLEVGKPKELVQRERQLTVNGKTTPGAIVSINGVRVEVGEDGSFSTKLALAEGPNQVSVEAEDVMGRKQRAGQKVTVDTKPPKVGGDVTWGP